MAHGSVKEYKKGAFVHLFFNLENYPKLNHTMTAIFREWKLILN